MQVVFKSFLSTEIRNTTVEVDQLVKHYVDHLLIIQVISNPEMVLEPLIRQALNLESEDYLKIPCEDYLKRIEKLKQLVESSGLQKEDKIKLLKLISDHEDQDQRLLLQYATPIEKEEIANAYHDARLSTVMEKIKNGEWDSLLMAYGNDIKFSYVLLAAYSQKMITLDELATAMIFHRAFYNAQTSFHIYPFEGEVKLDLEWDSEKVIGLNQIQVNQRYYVTIDSTAFDAYTKDLFESNFFGLVLAPPGVIKLEKESTIEYGIVSFGIAKAFIPNLKPILHLTPDSETMLKHGLLKFSDFALLFPDEVPNTHGSDDNTIFAPMHDLFHSHHRQKKKDFHPQMLATVDLALNYCKTNYESKLDSSKSGTLHRAFIKQPSKEELRSFFIDEVRGKIVDGSYSLNGYYWDDNLYNDSIKETILSVYRRLLKSPLLDRIMLEEIKNDLCNYLS